MFLDLLHKIWTADYGLRSKDYGLGIINNYYMAVSQKDWKQANRRIWLAKIDIDRGLDFPI